MKASQINNLRSFWVQNIQRYLYLTAGQTSLRLRISGFRLRSGRSTIHLRQIFESGSFSPRCAIAWLVSSRNRWVLARWGRKLFSCQNFEVIRHPSTRKECGLWISLYLLLQMSALLSALINQRWQGSILVGYGQLDLACFSIISSDIFVRTWWTRCSQTWSVYCFFKTVSGAHRWSWLWQDYPLLLLDHQCTLTPIFIFTLSSDSILGIIQFFFKNYKARINISSAGILPRSCFTPFNQHMLVSSDSTRSERNWFISLTVLPSFLRVIRVELERWLILNH